MAVRRGPEFGGHDRHRVARRRREASNATLDHGAYFVDNDCLQVRVGSAVFTPILPRGSSLEAGGGRIVVGGRAFEIGRRYSLPFAIEVGSTPGEVARSIGLPTGCSQRLLSMGSPS